MNLKKFYQIDQDNHIIADNMIQDFLFFNENFFIMKFSLIKQL